ncbi:MAG: DMT family transporter [Flavobacteriales bacterium]|nr:DMT family transporter [Flavobacteriales bacterium]
MNKILRSTPFLAIMACLLWASTFVPTKTGLTYFPSPLQFAGYTYLMAGILLLPWAKVGKMYFTKVRQNFLLVLKIALLSTSILYGAYYMGQYLIDSSLASLIVSAQPFFVSVMAHFMLKDERFTPLKVLSILLAVGGVVVVSYPSVKDVSVIGVSAVAGILLILVNCTSAAYSNIVVSRLDFSKVDIKVLNSAQLILGGVVLLIASYAVEGFVPLPKEGQFYVSYAVMVVITVITLVTWFALLARSDVKVSSLNMWKFLIPIFGTVESWIFLKNDSPNVYSVTGMVILTASLLLFYHRPLLQFFKKNKDKSVKI